MEVDHLIPKYLSGDELGHALSYHGLPSTFDIQAEENLAPSCGPCNGKKGKRIPPATPGIALLLESAAQRADEVRDRAARAIEKRKVEKLLGQLSMADFGNPYIIEALREGVDELGKILASAVPSIESLRLSPAVGIERDLDDIWHITHFTGFGDCPNQNCYTGDIDWRTYSSDGSAVDAGNCNTCGTISIRCPDCGAETGAFFDSVPCTGCDNEFSVMYDKDATDIETVLIERRGD
jgi:hypothetical protein